MWGMYTQLITCKQLQFNSSNLRIELFYKAAKLGNVSALMGVYLSISFDNVNRSDRYENRYKKSFNI